MGITLHVSEEGRDFLIEKGYDEKYGARPLRRTIQNQLEDKLAEKILDGAVKEGDEVDVIKAEEGLDFVSRTDKKENKEETLGAVAKV